jgi:MATE family multidrug resistance protein
MLQPLSHSSVLRIAVPIMLSNVSEPLIGVVNTAVMGRLPEAHYIGGITVGALIFAFLFWGFGFLRLSTGGLSAQAAGAGDSRELSLVFWRSITLAAGIGFMLLVLGPVIGPLSVRIVGGSAEVMHEAQTYFSYRIWSAPAALCNFAIMGWFVGQGRSTLAFVVQLFLNVTNMLLSMVFVLGLGMKSDGVGLAVILAQYAAAALGFAFALAALRNSGMRPSWTHVVQRDKFMALISSNADIMIRTFCLVFAFGWFTSRGAKAGDLMVAANAVLLNLFEVAAYLIDGFAYASEALVGQAIGARNRQRFADAIKLTTVWAIAFGGLFSLAIWMFGEPLIGAMTTNDEVRRLAVQFLPWAALTPILGTVSFQFDGIFTGAMATKDMRNMMLVSLAIFLASWWALQPLGNHGLWMALCIFFIARGITFGLRMPALSQRAFGTLSDALAVRSDGDDAQQVGRA